MQTNDRCKVAFWGMILFLCAGVLAADLEYKDTKLERIAFGSCHNNAHALHYPAVWPSIADTRPQVFLWGGDSVYARRDLTQLAGEYNRTKNYAPYADFLRNTSVRVLGTWDDHDYGVNDAGREADHKPERQQLFLDFLEVPPQQLPRGREGVYSSHVFGSPPSQTKVILLDTRSSRDSHFIPSAARLGSLPLTALIAAMSRWATAALGLGRELEAQVLSQEQWSWLEAELTNSTSQVHIIVSSIQVLTTNPAMESWGHFRREKLRLLKLLADTRPSGLVILSGDVHHAEFLAPGHDEAGGLLEVTSSGLTHSCASPFFGFMCPILLDTYHLHRLTPHSYYTGVNFGTIRVDWEAAALEVRIHDHQGAVLMQLSRPIGGLDFSPDAVPELLDGHGRVLAGVSLAALLATLLIRKHYLSRK